MKGFFRKKSKNQKEDISTEKDPLLDLENTYESLPKTQSLSKTVDDFELLFVVGRQPGGTKSLRVREIETEKLLFMIVVRKKFDTGRKVEIIKNANLSYPFLTSLLYFFESSAKSYYVYENYSETNELMFHLIENDEPFEEKEAQFYIAEIALCMNYIHSQGFCFENFHAESILQTKEAHILLDSTRLVQQDFVIPGDDEFSTVDIELDYISPETITNGIYSIPTDFWALGNCLFELMTGLPPFYTDNTNDMCHLILESDIDWPRDVTLTESLTDLISQLLKKKPNERLTDFTKLKNHQFFKGFDWDKCERMEIVPPKKKPKQKVTENTTDADDFEAFHGFTFTTESPINI